MSAAYTKGLIEVLAQAQISSDRFHVIAPANEGDRDETREQPRVVRAAMGTERKAIKGMRENHVDWSEDQIDTMYRLQRSNLKGGARVAPEEALRST